jgi:Fe-Mn family superoxide dismutase
MRGDMRLAGVVRVPHRTQPGEAMSGFLSRRDVLVSLAAITAGVTRAAAAPPKETGLSSEGLLVGRPGFQPRTVMPLPLAELPGFLSRAQLEAHYADYARDVDRLKATEKALREEGSDRYADLRRTQVASANAVLLHEFYFGGLAPQTVDMPRALAPHMKEHMGDLGTWREDFTRCAMAAKAWAVLVYDPYDDRWHDTVMDGDGDGAWIGGNPLVVCDVAEHAWAHDYARREDYVAKFLDHIDWNEVATRYRAVDRM